MELFISRRTIFMLFVFTAAFMVAGVLIISPQRAHAQDPPSREEVQRQVSELTQQMTVANEQYNRARDALEASHRYQNELEAQLAHEQAQHDGLQAEVGEFGAVAYEQGPLGNISVMFASQDPQAMFDQLSYLDILTAEQRSTITKLTASRGDLHQTKHQVDAEVSFQVEQEAKLRQQKEQLNADLAHWEQLERQFAPTKSSTSQATYNGQASGNAEVAVKFAYNQLGKPYSFGSSGPSGYDCSGLTLAAWAQAGVKLPHSAKQQYNSLPNKVARANLVPGDLVFFYSTIHHVGIYIGSGQVIHAPQPGTVVEIANVSSMPFYGAARP